MDISTHYCGYKLRNPLIASSSPMTKDVASIRRLEDAGIGAVVLPSLFEEQLEQQAVRLQSHFDEIEDSHAEATSYLSKSDLLIIGPDKYLDTISAAKAAVKIPVIASLNGAGFGGWVRYAKLIEQAGADAIELNIYYLATDAHTSSLDVEAAYLHVVRSVTEQVRIPVAVKIAPYFTSLAHMAQQIAKTKVAAIVLFNRFYQPDIDLEQLDIVPSLAFSRSDDLRLPLRWTALLRGTLSIDIAVTTGVHTHFDVLKALMAGANATMMASELLQNGVGRVGEILRDLQHWMEEKEYESVAQMQGSMSQEKVPDPVALERSNYVKVLRSQIYTVAAT